MNVSVTTRSFDGTRSGAQLHETVLTPAAVRARGIKQALVLKTPDDRQLEAQPLYLAGARVGGGTHDTIFQATMGNCVYAWDADTGSVLWRTSLGPPVKRAKAIDQHLINDHWGILSTPVIDLSTNRLYVCYWSSPSGKWADGHHYLASLDIATGKETHPAIDFEGATFDPGHNLHPLAFRSLERKQRAALALVDGIVLVPFGTIAESDNEAHGWLIAVDTRSWKQTATWCSTARGSGGGIWMSGSGPAIQSDGSIWLVTGNGEFDGVVDFGESVARLRYVPPPANNVNGKFEVTGWWTPWTDDGRLGKNPGGEAVAALLPERMPSNFRVGPYLASLGMEAMGDTWADQDLGASGIVLIEDLGIALVSGKDGILYTIRLDQPGNTRQADLAPAHVAANFAKLAAPPILYTYFDPSINPAPTDPAALNVYAAQRTHHLHGTPIVWKSAARGWMHYCGGENGNLRAWQLNADKSSAYLACSEAYASPECTKPYGGMPGWSIALSANGGDSAVVWAMIPYGDANMTITNSRLLAYDAQDFGRYADGSGQIVPLWDSQDWNWNLLHPKFNRPIVVDGRVLVPTYGGELLVLTLA
ncbi:PQQ-binding-like beta-propeller repeat protein [Paraburkholderia phymatum]|uniref:PQQ-binding-like beta-propeller repeat protein n=1 Tax=Paraburkholderia phymatum TaxID=148447 RepID=A0ACC6U9G5_9BURK